ncbi:hypothetical protein SAMN05216490_3236 [Mucilaginibacter mallensis]|uniref:Uncharacterized protein n=1 Tax=Mucilaginibacter mallensis TaxID=652787 RepID=A0A1H1ZST2_MUCMA|nr:hypothetical protein [Mucilaginibacter mallensis]SDT36768.1 hypothetical protein SAMN05216490_3236 [Mucilaginibacter mallensis]
MSGLKTKLVAHLQKSLQIDSSTGNATDDNPLLQRIDQYLGGLKGADMDNLKTTFLATQAEMLLDQAASLLDRATKDRAQWDELAIKNFIQTIEFNQFIELDNLHKEETDHMYAGVNNGFYQQQVNNIQRLLDTELMTQSVLTVASEFYKDFFAGKWAPGIIDDIINHYSQAV